MEETIETIQREQRTKHLAEMPIKKLLWQFALPSIIAMSASSIYNLCDSIFIGHGVDSMAIAGLAITFPLMNISSAFGAMIGIGSGALTSVRLGEGNKKQTSIILGTLLRMDFIIGLIITTLGLIFLDPILRLFGASDATLPYARDYMQIILMGNIVTHSFLGMNDIMRASGYPEKAMCAQLIAVITNIILDYIFIFVFHWGMRGAAIATVSGQVLALIFEILHYRKKSSVVHFTRESLKFSWQIVRNILAVGVSPFCVNVCGCIVVIFINKALMNYGGADGDMYVASYGIVNRLGMLLAMMVAGFSQGLQPIAGFNLGARKYDRVKKVLKYAYICATCIMVVGYLVITLFPHQLTMMFTTDEQLIEISAYALRLALCMFPIVGGQMITIAFFQAIRQARKAIFLSMTRQLLFLWPLILLLPIWLGPDGVWWSMVISDAISSLLGVILLCQQIKKFSSFKNVSSVVSS